MSGDLMPKGPGMMAMDELVQSVKTEKIDTVLVVFSDLYGRLMGKRLDAEFFLEHDEKIGIHACDYLLTVDMEMNPVPGYKFSNWEKGYGDFHLVPDITTLRQISWLEKTAMVICDVHDPKTHKLLGLAPRSLLRKQVEKAKTLGYTSKAGSELEYYIFRESYQDVASKGYRDLKPAGWYIEDYHILQGTREESFNGAVRRHLKHSGIPVENSKGEWGRGQHELNVRYADVLTMADRHTIYKQCFKEVADQLGISVTFMAKVSADQGGSGCHLHVSLWKDGKNAFAGKKKFGPLQSSNIFRWFLGGWMAHVAEFAVFYAPTVNSYKRFQSGSWAPTRIAWSHDNRTAAFRVVGEGESLRIECRIPGADCNPYLAYAGVLASGLDGIAKKMEPPPHFQGDAYQAQELISLPQTLGQAVDVFQKSSFVKSALGEDVVDHYAHFYRSEVTAFEKAVTDWERQRYFERI